MESSGPLLIQIEARPETLLKVWGRAPSPAAGRRQNKHPFPGHPAAGSGLAALSVIGRRQEPCLKHKQAQNPPLTWGHTEGGTIIGRGPGDRCEEKR